MSILDRLIPFNIPIYHMASMARSGETLLQRTLRAHPKIHVVHNFYREDSPQEHDLFDYLKRHDSKEISSKDSHLSHLRLTQGQILLLKQSVWEHRFPFNGFILARNPVSIFSSLKTYDQPGDFQNWKLYWEKNTARFRRWLKDIDPKMLDGFDDLSPIDQFCLFYNRRMNSLADTGLPIVHYENFVKNPASEVLEILHILSLKGEGDLNRAHEHFGIGEIGHGKIDLSQPIRTDSIYRYLQFLSPIEIEEIATKTEDTCSRYGFEVTTQGIYINGRLV